MATNGLKKYQALKKRAARKGIVVPRGTNMVELEALLDGKVARCVTTPAKPAKKAPAKKAPAKKAPAKKAPAKKPAPSRTPTATTTTRRKRRSTSSSSGQGSLFGFD